MSRLNKRNVAANIKFSSKNNPSKKSNKTKPARRRNGHAIVWCWSCCRRNRGYCRCLNGRSEGRRGRSHNARTRNTLIPRVVRNTRNHRFTVHAHATSARIHSRQIQNRLPHRIRRAARHAVHARTRQRRQSRPACSAHNRNRQPRRPGRTVLQQTVSPILIIVLHLA
jgi:hypothetical protein